MCKTTASVSPSDLSPFFFTCHVIVSLKRRSISQCEISERVVGILTLLVGGVAQAFNDDRVVELRVQLRVEEVDGKKDREEQVEVEREKRVKEGAPWMAWRWL